MRWLALARGKCEQKLWPWQTDCAHAEQVIGGHLAVQEVKFPRTKLRAQTRHCDFASVGGAAKH